MKPAGGVEGKGFREEVESLKIESRREEGPCLASSTFDFWASNAQRQAKHRAGPGSGAWRRDATITACRETRQPRGERKSEAPPCGSGFSFQLSKFAFGDASLDFVVIFHAR